MYKPLDTTSQQINSSNQYVVDRNEAINIYRTSFIGKRIAESIINYAMMNGRAISVLNAPQEVATRFIKTAISLEQNNSIYMCAVYARLFGVAGLYIATEKIKKPSNDDKLDSRYGAFVGASSDHDESYNDLLTFDNIEDYKIRFNPLDSLVISGTVVCMSPFSVSYLRTNNLKIIGQHVRPERLSTIYSGIPIYNNNNNSNVPFAPPSIYYNMLKLIIDYEKGYDDLSNILDKAGCVLFNYKIGSKIDGVTISNATEAAKKIKEAISNNVIALPQGATAENWSSKDIDNICLGLEKTEHGIIQALNDTPASIFQENGLSNGLAEGSEEMKAVVMAIKSFREKALDPLYQLTDPIVMMKAWDLNFVEGIKFKYKKYRKMSISQIRQEWIKCFKATYVDPYPEPESVRVKNTAYTVQTLNNLINMGASQESISKEINDSDLFKNDINFTHLPIQREEKVSPIKKRKSEKLEDIGKQGVLNLEGNPEDKTELNMERLDG